MWFLLDDIGQIIFFIADISILIILFFLIYRDFKADET
jgi:hypothetical protein